MANLAAEGITTICCNFMPVLDWTRTDLVTPVARGGTCLRFSAPKMAAFEVHMLGRDAARNDYEAATLTTADLWFQSSDDATRYDQFASIMAGLSGAFDAPENGLTLCSGSLGSNPKNDVPQIADTFGKHIHFAHLRNVRKEADGSFEEAPHLNGDTDMVAVNTALLDVENRCETSIPFRPNQGHDLFMDKTLGTQAGYPLIGRLRGLAELKGRVIAVCSSFNAKLKEMTGCYAVLGGGKLPAILGVDVIYLCL
jgi:D-mannonate dehydratase